MLQIAGLYKATLWGLVGLVAGGQIGINSASRGAYCLARLTPGFMMAAMLFPRLQVPHATISSSVTSTDASFAASSCLCPVCVRETCLCLPLVLSSQLSPECNHKSVFVSSNTFECDLRLTCSRRFSMPRHNESHSNVSPGCIGNISHHKCINDISECQPKFCCRLL